MHFPFLALIQSVSMLLTDMRATCSAHNIYPAPQVTWATEPSSAQEGLENSTVKMTDHKGLFHVESSLRILSHLSNCTYICSVTSADRTQVWTASRKKQGVLCFRSDQFRAYLLNERKHFYLFQTASHTRRVTHCPSPASARTLSTTSPSPGRSHHLGIPQSS